MFIDVRCILFPSSGGAASNALDAALPELKIVMTTRFYQHSAPPELKIVMARRFYKHCAPPERGTCRFV